MGLRGFLAAPLAAPFQKVAMEINYERWAELSKDDLYDMLSDPELPFLGDLTIHMFSSESFLSEVQTFLIESDAVFDEIDLRKELETLLDSGLVQRAMKGFLRQVNAGESFWENYFDEDVSYLFSPEDPRVLEENRDEKEEALYICILKACSERIPRELFYAYYCLGLNSLDCQRLLGLCKVPGGIYKEMPETEQAFLLTWAEDNFRDPLSSKLWNVAEQHLIYADMLLEDTKKKEANNKAKREASRKVYNKKKKRI